MSGDIVGYNEMGYGAADIIGESFVGHENIGVMGMYTGDDDIDRLLAMGAAPIRHSPARRAHPAPGRHFEVVNKEQGVWREHYLPLNLTGGPTATIAGGATVTVTTLPQRKFRPNRLIISSDVAGGFVVNDVRVGILPQLVAVGSLPGRMFTETAVGIGLHGDTAEVSQQISVVVQNITGGALPFVAALQGIAVF